MKQSAFNFWLQEMDVVGGTMQLEIHVSEGVQ